MKKNITIKEFITAIKFNIGDGFEYLWDCYGKNAYSIGWMKPDRTATASIIYDMIDQTVYQMEVWDELNNRVYRWISLECAKAHKKEAQKRQINDSIALDRVKYEEVSPSKIMSLLKTIYSRRNKKLGCLRGGR
jgi:hypothetical protein